MTPNVTIRDRRALVVAAGDRWLYAADVDTLASFSTSPFAACLPSRAAEAIDEIVAAARAEAAEFPAHAATFVDVPHALHFAASGALRDVFVAPRGRSWETIVGELRSLNG